MLKNSASCVAATRAFVVAIICALSFAMGCSTKKVPDSVQPDTLSDPMTPDPEFRGMWVATAYNLDWPPRQYLHPSRLTDEIRATVARARELNMNVIMLEVRSFDDRMYRTTQFP